MAQIRQDTWASYRDFLDTTRSVFMWVSLYAWDQPSPSDDPDNKNNIKYRICSSYPYDAADRSKEHDVDISMRLALQPTIQLLKQAHHLMAVAGTQVARFFLLPGPHRRLVDTDKIDRQRLSGSRSLQDKVDRPAVNSKK